MKGKKVLLYLIMCIGLVSCSKNEQEGNGFILYSTRTASTLCFAIF